MIKVTEFDLNSDVVNVYDKTKTTVFGRAFQKNISGIDVVGPPLTKYSDFATPSGGLVPDGRIHVTANGRKFMLSTSSAGLVSLLLWDFDLNTGLETYRGRVVISLPNAPATTHTARALRVVNDAGTTGWRVFIQTIATGTNATQNGGTLVANNVDLADFSTGPSPLTIRPAVADDQKGTYFYQDPALLGLANVALNTAIGLGWKESSNELLVAYGTAGTLNGQGFSTSLAPTLTKLAVTAPTSGNLTWTTGAAHGYANNDAVVFTTTGAAPGGFTASTAAVHQVYFIRNVIYNKFSTYC